MKSSMWNVSGEGRHSTHSGLFGELLAIDALLSWGSSVLRAPALLQGKGVCAGRQPPVSSQLITQLCACLTFGWTCSWGFWTLSPAPFSLTLELSTECVCVCVSECVCVSGKMLVCVWVGHCVMVAWCTMALTGSD